MMMPAKFSVVTENEMTYVIGGGVSNLGEFGANLAKNAWTIVGNTFVGGLIHLTLGTMFGGGYGVGDVFKAFGNYYSAFDGLNGILQTVGFVAAVDQLTNGAVKNFISNAGKTTINWGTEDDPDIKKYTNFWTVWRPLPLELEAVFRQFV